LYPIGSIELFSINSMKRLSQTTALLIFGLAIPLISLIAQLNVLAWDRDPSGLGHDRQLGAFSDGKSTVCVDFKKDLHYYLTFSVRGDAARTISLQGAIVSQTAERETYTWRGTGGGEYQVVWKPTDPKHIRLIIKTPNGRELVNQRLSSTGICNI
jgi:hypothetical protein